MQKYYRLLITAFLMLFVLLVDYSSDRKDSPAAVSGFYQVNKVVDGDTIKVVIDNEIKSVRLVGINAPESVDPRRPVECMGKAASDHLKQILDGQQVRLEQDETQSDQDRYGRLLRFVFLADGTDVGLRLIQEGYATESLYSAKPHKYRPAYLAGQQDAQANNRGLWSPENCPPTTP